MADASASSSPDPSFSQPFSDEFAGPERDESGTDAQQTGEGPDGTSFALSAAKHWVRQHQKASMLGALAAGVFVGVLIRD